MSEHMLEVVEKETATDLYVNGGADKICEWIEAQTEWDHVDLEKEEGRRELKSRAYAVARAKTRLKEKQQELTADFKKKAKTIDVVGKRVWEFCEGLQERILEPLTERTARIDAALAEEAQQRQEEQEAKDRELEDLRAKDALRVAEDEQKAKYERIKKEAGEKAKADAEAAAEAANVAARKAQQDADAAKITAAREKKEAEEKTTQDFADATRRGILEREEAKAEAERQKRLAVQKSEQKHKDLLAQVERNNKAIFEEEHQRVADEKQAEAQEKKKEERRAANKLHRERVEREAIESFLILDYSQTESEGLVAKICLGEIKHVTINY